MQDFYVSLPSNTPGEPQYSRENTSSHFRVRLAHEIKLPINEQWEVGLVELQYPYSWNNITDDPVPASELDSDIVVKPEKQNEVVVVGPGASWDTALETVREVVSLEPAHYDSIDGLLYSIMEAGKEEDYARKYLGAPANIFSNTTKYDYRLHLDDLLKKVVFTTHKLDGGVTAVQLSPLLQYVLGFEKQKLVLGKQAIKAKYPPDLRAGLDSLYVYCDIIQPQLVGDKVEKIIRIVPVSGKYGEIISRVFVAPHYVPVLNKQFATIEITINTDRNRPFAFRFGKSVVKLHFRKKPRA